MKKKILIIDDSALMRRVISDIINSDDRLQVESMASNGYDALKLLTEGVTKYDAILLDINMPKMNGLEFLEQVKKLGIKVRIIVVSTVAKEGVKETIKALELGAFDFVTKPGSFIEAKSTSFRELLLNCLIYAVGLEAAIVNAEIVELKKTPIIKKEKGSYTTRGVKIVALACSTGGPKALQEVIPNLPKNLDAPVLIVQHMPGGFTKSLAQRLDELSKVHVKEAEDNDILQKGTVYIAKGGYHLHLKKQGNGTYKIAITQEPPRGGLRPCADIMYESMVDSDFEQITCVVLTGMGSDGTRGIRQLQVNKNIYVIAQSEETCTVYGMPKVVAEAGLVNEVVPLKGISDAITKKVGVR